MKSIRVAVWLVVLALGSAALAQSDGQKSLEKMKALAGDWEGSVTVTPAEMHMSMDKPIHISLRVTSRGNAVVHEMQEAATPLDPSKYDHPVTMFYMDGDQLTLLHYCDAGNRPRMLAKPSIDGKTLDFDFVDVTGNLQYGHMQHSTFTVIDANHHNEDWTFLMPGDKLMHAHMELKRVN
ncbi:MAG TPA: hypothetical protein VGS27_17885 [Candidatus Sulfotelmatobacter sp.]|nr:hypothetical protein [Candidatus Sulfotelmatobacter sp.]